MIKQAFLCVELLLLLSGCSSPSKNSAVRSEISADHGLPFPRAERVSVVKKLWSQQLDGYITDLAVAKRANVVWVGTAPNRDADPGQKISVKYELRRFSHDGKRDWVNDTLGPIKSIDLNASGDRAIVTTHDEEMMAMDATGKILWKVEADCRPIVLEPLQKIVCYHDDDAEPLVAFDIYSWSGKKLLSYPISGDILALKVSPDQKFIAIALTHGRVVLFGPDFRPIWQRNVEGEIADISIAQGAEKVAVVSSGKHPDEVDPSQTLTVFGHAGGLQRTQGIPGHAEQFELSPAGDVLFYYGNSEKGQRFGGLQLGKKKDWEYLNLRYADYSSRIWVGPERFMLSFEDEDEGTRHSHVLGFNHDGKLAVNLGMSTQEGIYQFGVSRLEGGVQEVFVATDDSVLAVYKVIP